MVQVHNLKKAPVDAKRAGTKSPPPLRGGEGGDAQPSRDSGLKRCGGMKAWRVGGAPPLARS